MHVSERNEVEQQMLLESTQLHCSAIGAESDLIVGAEVLDYADHRWMVPVRGLGRVTANVDVGMYEADIASSLNVVGQLINS